MLPAVARLCVVLTVLSLLAEEVDARFEKLCRPDMMLCGLREERWDDDRLGGLSAAYGCRCWIDERPGDELGSGAEVDGGVAGGGPLGGVSRFGSTPCRDQRFVSKDVRGGCSFDPDPIDDADDQDDLGRPDEEPTPLTLRVGVVEGDTGEGDDDEAAGIADKNALPLCLTPSVSAVLALLWLKDSPLRSPLLLDDGGVPIAVYARRRGAGCSAPEACRGTPLL